MKVASTIKDSGENWTALQEMDTPQGAATDEATLAKQSLELKKRLVKQGPVVIDLSFADDKAIGKMSMNGQDKPISADLGGPLFADAAGGDEVLACLPLADGYSTSFRNFDIQTQKPKLLQASVAASEKVTVPAGTFDAYRVEVTSADGGSDKKTVWVEKSTHKVVKVSAVVAAMGGATVTEELVD
jgi:hypothetical protein